MSSPDTTTRRGRLIPTAFTLSNRAEMFSMYDMYPEWGPSRHRDDNDDALSSVQAGLDLRDNGGQRPDDN